MDTLLGLSVFPSPIESLLSTEQVASPWPQKLFSESSLGKETFLRQTAIQYLEKIYQSMPNNADIKTAVDGTLVSISNAVLLYDSFCTLLNDPINDRLILYLPFELLPDALWHSTSSLLNFTKERFIQAYRASWHRLLSVEDVRANFVDGDVPEMEICRQLPRVVKATHLLPALIEKGLVTKETALQLVTDYPSSVLAESITAALVSIQENESSKYLPPDVVMNYETLAHLDNVFLRQITSFVLPMGISAARKHWLSQKHEESIVHTYGQQMARGILMEILSPRNLLEFLRHTMSEDIAHRTVIRAMRIAVETTARSDIEKARELYRSLTDIVQWKTTRKGLRDERESMIYRFVSLSVIEIDLLYRYGLTQPRLDASFSDLRDALQPDIASIHKSIEDIMASKELAAYLYPVVILYGSRVKGYGTSTADLDIAVFVRPDTLIEDRPKLEQMLRQLFGREKMDGKALQFWLKHDHSCLCVQDFPNPDTFLGDSSLVHVLFEGIWCGHRQAIEQLHEKLLSPYLFATDERKRKLWLEELERDTLLYRLVHRGYARFYAEQGTFASHYGHLLDTPDAPSTFWDSGYRRLATTLFIKKVFLPHLWHSY